MNRIKLLVLSACSMALLASAPFDLMAGLNRNAPGLPVATYNSVLVGNNGFSSMCVDCHGRNPVSGATTYGSHFVATGPAAASTNSGGGWDNTGVGGMNAAGKRANGAYFKINRWPSGGYSKYGDTTTDNSYSTNIIGNYTGIVVDNTTASTYATREIICESCHNILINAAGGNNLLAAPVAQNVAAAEDPAAAVIPNLCVGCHGDMYQSNAANNTIGGTHATKYNSVRNANEVSGGRKGVNSVHYINGVLYAMNHHVTTGDSVDNTTVGVGLTWRDTLSIDPSALLVPVSNATGRGQMPQLGTWLDGKSKPPTAIDCLNCHTHGHNGSQYTAASILRDTSALLAAVPTEAAADKGLSRIGENTRKWLELNDFNYCNDCHTLAAGR